MQAQREHRLAMTEDDRLMSLKVDDQLDRLAAAEPEWCRIVEVKYLLGLTDDEAAAGLGMPPRTLQRAWRERDRIGSGVEQAQRPRSNPLSAGAAWTLPASVLHI